MGGRVGVPLMLVHLVLLGTLGTVEVWDITEMSCFIRVCYIFLFVT